jgi:hypothetical protein
VDEHRRYRRDALEETMISRSLTAVVAVLALTATSPPGWTCGFENPNSATMQRVMLNVVYPNAIHVQGAVDTALRSGALRPAHFTRPGDFFALQRTTRNLRRFADILADGESANLPTFSVVLMGPVLWTRFVPTAGRLTSETHVAGPLPGKVVVVTDVPALAALVSGDVTGASTNPLGLIRYYGDPTEIESLRAAIAVAFPGAAAPREAAVGLK